MARSGTVGSLTLAHRVIQRRAIMVLRRPNIAMLLGENAVLRKIVERMRVVGRMNGWMRMIEKYMGELGIDWGMVSLMNVASINGLVNDWENERWRREVESKSTLIYYRLKQGIGGVPYDYVDVQGEVEYFEVGVEGEVCRWGCWVCDLWSGGGDTVSFSGGVQD